jgi:class 3 adenylate cyclase
MHIDDELVAGIDNVLHERFEITHGTAIPRVEDVALDGAGRELDMAMLFVDIRSSTDITDALHRHTAAKMYKAFMWGVAAVARSNGGEMLTSATDGLLLGFVDADKEQRAVRTAMNLVWLVNEVLTPRLQSDCAGHQRAQAVGFDFGIGIHTGPVLIVRAGIRGAHGSDVLWVGNATAVAATLAGEAHYPNNIRVSFDVKYELGEAYQSASGTSLWNLTFSRKLRKIAYDNSWWWRP